MQNEKKQRFITDLAEDEKDMEGKITLRNYDTKMKLAELQNPKPVETYVKNFSDARHTMTGAGLINNIIANTLFE